MLLFLKSILNINLHVFHKLNINDLVCFHFYFNTFVGEIVFMNPVDEKIGDIEMKEIVPEHAVQVIP